MPPFIISIYIVSRFIYNVNKYLLQFDFYIAPANQLIVCPVGQLCDLRPVNGVGCKQFPRQIIRQVTEHDAGLVYTLFSV